MENLIWHTETRKVADLKLWDKNPRTISGENFEKLKERIQKRGFHDVIKIDIDNTILSGNQRKRALIDLGIEEVECKVPNRALTERERDQVALESNRNDGLWDFDILANQFDYEVLQDVGFEGRELDKIFDTSGEDDGFDTQAELEKISEPVAKLGDVWQLGKHRLVCGDATKIEDVEKLMAGVKADMVFTDPPYNVDYEGKTKEALKIQNDRFAHNSEFYNFLLASFTNLATFTKKGGAIYVCHSDSEGLNFRKAFIDAGFELKQCLIWNKSSMVMGRQDYHWKHEPILYGWQIGESHNWYGTRNQTTVWDIERPFRNADHPTMKPIELIVKALTNSSKTEDIILDLFGGSGSTLIACEKTRRICYMMELDPKYCDVIIKRWEVLTGQKAELTNQKEANV